MNITEKLKLRSLHFNNSIVVHLVLTSHLLRRIQTNKLPLLLFFGKPFTWEYILLLATHILLPTAHFYSIPKEYFIN